MKIYSQTEEFVAMFIEMEDGKGFHEVVDETPETCEEAAVLAMFIFRHGTIL